jgi:hypothetical protein
MNPKIEKAQKKLQDSKLIREQKKAHYDGTVILVEGQRNTLKNLESRSNDSLTEFMESDRAVAEFEKQLKEIIDEINNQQNETEREGV